MSKFGPRWHARFERSQPTFQIPQGTRPRVLALLTELLGPPGNVTGRGTIARWQVGLNAIVLGPFNVSATVYPDAAESQRFRDALDATRAFCKLIGE